MRKKINTHKGMTLYEMIISIAIFAVMCLVLVGVGMHIDRVHQATNDLKKKVASEAPVAASKRLQDNDGNNYFDAAKDVSDIQISIKMDNGVNKTYYIPGDSTAHTGKAEVKLDAKKYSTERIYNAEKSKKAVSDTANDPISASDAEAAINGQLNLEFIIIDTTAPASTSSTTTTTTTTTTT